MEREEQPNSTTSSTEYQATGNHASFVASLKFLPDFDVGVDTDGVEPWDTPGRSPFKLPMYLRMYGVRSTAMWNGAGLSKCS